MKLSVKPELLKLLAVAAGSTGFALRALLYSIGLDEKGLLVSGHWAGIALWILTGAVIGVFLLLTRSIQGPETYAEAHPASFFSGFGTLIAAAAIGYGIVGVAVLPIALLGIAAALCLAVIGICRMRGKRPSFLCHTVFCVFLAIRMVSQYQNWNSDPQILDYVFYLSAYVALMLHAYQQAAFDAGIGSHRNLWCTGLIAVYLCCVSLSGTADAWLQLGACIWAAAGLTNLNVRIRRQRPALNLDEEPSREEE